MFNFIVGLFIGAVIGYVIAALCNAAGHDDYRPDQHESSGDDQNITGPGGGVK